MYRVIAPVAIAFLTGCAGLRRSPPAELPLPPRPASALTGSAVAARVRDLPLRERETLVEQQILSGNVPEFLRRLVPISVSATIDGVVHTVTYHVTSDYVAVGRDDDFFRTPLSAGTAQRLADQLGCALPTRKMVDDIHRAAVVKLAPRPFDPKQQDIASVRVFEASHHAIETDRSGRPGLIAGIKKDVVVSPLIDQRRGRVVIYGWHRLDGEPIQPLWSGHSDAHVDYSHGIRLVARRVIVDGEEAEFATLLADRTLWPLLSDEGPFGAWRYPRDR